MPRQIRDDSQLALDERVLDEPDLEKLLERRLRAADDVAELRKTYKEADAAAKDRLATLGLNDGDAVRLGRFRITKSAVASRAVSFETAPTSRLTISVTDREPTAAASRPEPDQATLEADLLPGAGGTITQIPPARERQRILTDDQPGAPTDGAVH